MALRKHLAGASALVASAAVALVGAASVAQAGTEQPGSAFGLSAKGPVAIKPLPIVEATEEKPVHKSVLPSAQNGLISASSLDVIAGRRQAEARAADVIALQRKVTAGAISARCEGGRGVANLANAVVAGKEIDSSPAPNTRIPIDIAPYGKGSVTFNRQYRMDDGRLSVTGMTIEVPLAQGKQQTIDVASVACGKAKKDASSTRGTKDTKKDKEAKKKGTEDKKGATPDLATDVEQDRVDDAAPAPSPARADLPVTG